MVIGREADVGEGKAGCGGEDEAGEGERCSCVHPHWCQSVTCEVEGGKI